MKNNSAGFSISSKFLLLITAVTGIALLLSGVATIYSGRELLLENLLKDVDVLAELTSMNSSAVIMFEEQKGAEQMLANLSSQPSIVTAALYKADGELLSHYIREEAGQIPPHTLPEYGTQITEQGIRMVKPIFMDGDNIGGIYIESDLERLADLTRQVIILLLIIGFLVLFVAVIFSIRLQKIIIAPIITLTKLTKKVTKSKDFSQRAKKTANDETGTLIDGFNLMMGEIESKDKILQKKNHDLAIAEQNAISASEAKSSFLANMSHEIRTPMNGVLGMLELLDSTELQDDQQEFSRTARNSAEALLDVINDILDFSKIEAGQLEVEKLDMELLPLCEDVTALLSDKAHEKNIELTCFVHSDVPVMIMSDPTRLRQVLLNLMGNAIKFTSSGEVSLKVSLIRQGEGNAGCSELRFSVLDTGIGITDEQQHGLFEAFSQADISTTRKFGGTGLGLSISKQLIELLGGEIHVESNLGQGSEFWFNLPVELSETRPAEDSLANLTDKKVLIVDDNDTNRMILEHYCSNWGMHYSSFDNAISALKELDSTIDKFDCAVIDLCMPEMDGAELAAKIRKHSVYKNLPILMLSSANLSDGSEYVDISLMKPVRQTLLFKNLAKLLFPLHKSAKKEVGNNFPKFNANILLVDDNLINQKVAGGFLEKLGANIDYCENGKDALNQVNVKDYDLVFMDCQMPVMDGYQATGAIRQWEEKNSLPALPIIAMTANVLPGDREKCLAAGMDDYLAKPIQVQFVIKILRKWLAESNQDETNEIESEHNEDSELSIGNREESLDAEQIILKNAEKLQMEPSYYQTLLSDFYDQDVDTVNKIQDLLENEKYSIAAELIHRVKGTAGNLGFCTIFDEANKLEQQVIGKLGKKIVLVQFFKFAKKLNEIMLEIAKLKEREATVSDKGNEYYKINYNEVQKVLSLLSKNLIRQSSKAESNFEFLNELIPEGIYQERILLINAVMKQLDYEHANRLVIMMNKQITENLQEND